MKKPIVIGISKIEEVEFVFKPGNLKKIDPKKLDIKFTLGFDWNLESELYLITLTVLYKYKVDNSEVELSKFISTISYEIKGLENIINIDGDGLISPDFLMLGLVGTSISSARGMLLYKHAGTILAEFYLPLVDPNDILTQMDDIDKKNKSVNNNRKKN